MNILVISPQICYIEVFDITNPCFNEQIHPVSSNFVKSRFHCIWQKILSKGKYQNGNKSKNVNTTVTKSGIHVYIQEEKKCISSRLKFF